MLTFCGIFELGKTLWEQEDLRFGCGEAEKDVPMNYAIRFSGPIMTTLTGMAPGAQSASPTLCVVW